MKQKQLIEFIRLGEREAWVLEQLRKHQEISVWLLYRLFAKRFKEPPKSLVLLLWGLEDKRLILWDKRRDVVGLLGKRNLT